MDDRKILQHLLDLESQAAALVNDAQAEADRRTAEGENQNRALYEESYAQETEALEKGFTETISAAKENYREELERYRDSLKSMPRNSEAFSALAGKFLFAESRKNIPLDSAPRDGTARPEETVLPEEAALPREA